jgi:hypothetical protein
MARRPNRAWDAKPVRPIFYGLVARGADRLAGKGDGNGAIPPLPTGSVEEPDPHDGMTPYLEIRTRHFRDRAERERRHMLNDLEPVYRQLAALRQQIAGADEKVTDIRKRLDSIPETPSEEALGSRNAVEQHADEALVRARRRREHLAYRSKVVAEEREAVEEVRRLRVQEAELTGAITARKEILETRVRQLHEHTLRRCGTYRRHLVRKHPDGPALIRFLNLALPRLPDWLERREPGAAPPMV